MWIKSSFCTRGDCVEVEYRKSSFCALSSCVEVASADDLVLVRDTKDRTKPPHEFTPAGWSAFVAGVKAGEFDI